MLTRVLARPFLHGDAAGSGPRPLRGRARARTGPGLTAEARLALLRSEYARLVAAARASIAAARAGAADPLAYLEAELARHHGLPQPGAAVPAVLADAAAAMSLASQVGQMPEPVKAA
jgi:hypothetical protein